MKERRESEAYVELGFAVSAGGVKGNVFNANEVVSGHQLRGDREREAGEIVRWPLDRATAVGYGAEFRDLKTGDKSLVRGKSNLPRENRLLP